MSAPATPLPTKPTLAQEVGIWLDPAHVVLVILLVVALLGGVYLWESKRAEVAEAKAEIATQVAEAAKQAALSSATKIRPIKNRLNK